MKRTPENARPLVFCKDRDEKSPPQTEITACASDIFKKILVAISNHVNAQRFDC